MRYYLLAAFFWITALLTAQEGEVVRHTVEPGETIFSISRKYRTTPYQILRANPGLNEHIKPGDTIYIPAAPRTDTLLAGNRYSGFKYHTVKENETVFSIAKQYRTTIEDIIRVNKIEDNNIKVGQILIVPILYDPYARLDTTRYTIYIVKPKEGKWRVAYNHGISVEELERLNPSVKGKPLQVNQRLIVPKNRAETKPEADKNYIYYEVKPLETLYSLSKRFGISQEELIRHNPSLAEGLKAGQILKIPKQKPTRPADRYTNRFIYHEVQPKETVYGITKRYHISIDRLMHYNPQLKEGLKAGMVLRIPKPDFLIVFDMRSPLFFRVEKLLSPEAAAVNLLENMDKKRHYRFAVLLPLKLTDIPEENACSHPLVKSKVLDYFAGIRAAVDSLRSLGVKVDFDLYDTKGTLSGTHDILVNHDLTDYDFVLGPLYTSNIRKTLEALGPFNTPVVVPSFKSVSAYPNLVQTAADSAAMAEHMLSYLRTLVPGRNVIVVHDARSRATADSVAVSLGTIHKVQARQSKKGSWIHPADLRSKLSPYRENLVVAVTDDMSLLANLLSVAEGMTADFDIRMFTLEKPKNPEAFDIKKMAAVDFHFPARGSLIPDARLVRYTRNRYGLIPSKAYINGFDTVFDLILRLGNADNLFDGLKKFGKTKETSYIFLYAFRPQSGFKNIGSYIFRINEDLEPEEVD
ncbi:MAG: LysM peptidoglycan-binding domain-containing protein [Chlorobi bacterium]|nr:LysM peptidoglycan-binding domain-containing protein [Chlorobiota bacterium]